MGFDDAYQLGYIRKTHGLKGQVVASLDVDDPDYYQNLESVFLNQGGSLVPFFLKSINVQGKEAILTIEDFSSKDEASTLVGKELWLPTTHLPDLPSGAYYYHDLIGYTLYDGQIAIGKVEHIYSLPNNHLLGVTEKSTGKEVLVPTQEGVVEHVHHEEKRIVTKLPEGLIDLYLNEE